MKEEQDLKLDYVASIITSKQIELCYAKMMNNTGYIIARIHDIINKNGNKKYNR